MSEETERKLLSWEEDEVDSEDSLHIHFQDFGQWYWPDIADEGRRVFNLMFKEDVENGSPMAGVFSAVAAQACHGAFAAVAAALGVDCEALELAVAEWYEAQDSLPDPVTPERFMELCSENAEWLRGLHERHNAAVTRRTDAGSD